MKKLFTLLTVLTLSTFAGAGLVTFQSIPAGAPGSATNPLLLGQQMNITIVVSEVMVNLNAVITLTDPTSGEGIIAQATGRPEASSFGWSSDPNNSYDPLGEGSGQVEIGLGTPLNGPFKQAGNAAMITIEATGGAGTAILAIADSVGAGSLMGGSLDNNFSTPSFQSPLEIYYDIPEPLTLGILGMGGMSLGIYRRFSKNI